MLSVMPLCSEESVSRSDSDELAVSSEKRTVSDQVKTTILGELGRYERVEYDYFSINTSCVNCLSFKFYKVSTPCQSNQFMADK